MSTCGLDFGTSNTALALPSGDVVPIDDAADDARLFRSVLFFPEEERDVLGGAAAIARYLDEGEGRFVQSVKTWLPDGGFDRTQIRGRSWRLEDLVATILRRVREAAARSAGTELASVVMGRPAVFSEDAAADALAEARLADAARRAGFAEVRFVIEPIAAALAYEASLRRDELVLVGDFGAGTSDFTLMRLGPSRRGRADRRADVVASRGIAIGGDRFDGEIMRHVLLRHFGEGTTYQSLTRRMPIPQHLLAKLLSWHRMSFVRDRSTLELLDRMLRTSDDVAAIERLEDLVLHNLGFALFRAIEAAKVRLSSASEAVVEFDARRIRLRERIRRADFEAFTRPLVETLAACVDAVLAVAAAPRVDAVFLTGGTSQIPAVRRIFAERFGEDRLRSADAFTSVAAGLGRAAAA